MGDNEKNMSINLKDFYTTEKNQNAFENDLKSYVKDNNGYIELAIGVVLIIVSIVGFMLTNYAYSRNFNLKDYGAYYICYCNIYHTCLYVSGTISIFIIIAAIMCFVSYKNTRAARAKFQQEQISLRDLTIAMSIADGLDDENIFNKNDEREKKILRLASRTKMKEEIIQALLSRYN